MVWWGGEKKGWRGWGGVGHITEDTIIRERSISPAETIWEKCNWPINERMLIQKILGKQKVKQQNPSFLVYLIKKKMDGRRIQVITEGLKTKRM